MKRQKLLGGPIVCRLAMILNCRGTEKMTVFQTLHVCPQVLVHSTAFIPGQRLAHGSLPIQEDALFRLLPTEWVPWTQDLLRSILNWERLRAYFCGQGRQVTRAPRPSEDSGGSMQPARPQPPVGGLPRRLRWTQMAEKHMKSRALKDICIFLCLQNEDVTTSRGVGWTNWWYSPLYQWHPVPSLLFVLRYNGHQGALEWLNTLETFS